MYTKYVFAAILIFSSGLSHAQRDTSRPVSIDITSAYKPVLRNAVKINFSGTHIAQDTNRMVSPYNIPSQHLFYAYQPVSLKPLALEQDTTLHLGMRHFVKAGFGSYSTPYLKAGTSFGDGKTLMGNIYGDYISSKGSIRHQDYTIANIRGAGSYFIKDHEAYASVGLSSKTWHLYGYDHSLFNPEKKDIRQRFTDAEIHAGIKNTVPNKWGVKYDPNIRVNFFSLADRLTETSFSLKLPAEKTFSNSLTIKAELDADLTRYSTDNLQPDTSFSNNVVTIRPSIRYFQPRFFVNGGFSPAWDNGKLHWLPEIYFEAQLSERLLMLQGGYIGRIYKNTVRNLSAYNPYLQPITERFNTKETEFYGGIKATIGSHFNFSGKVSWITYKNFALFINDTTSAVNSFQVADEEKINNLRVHGNVSYVFQETLNLTAAFTLNGFTGQKTFNRAWNTLPMEIRGSARWWMFKKLMIKGDIYTFAGGKYPIKDGGFDTVDGGTDLSLGAEYRINKQFSAWMDVNNILSDKYSRWPQYPVYGLNLLGGIIINF